jgi:hypothetical protein
MAPRKYRLLNGIDPSILLLFITFLIGGYIRLAYVLQSDFPINDGGLFYTLIKDLMANHYRLPLTTSYNHLNLPFAYPPFIFYLSGFLADLTSWGLINIIRILPAIFTVLTIPAFFLLASVLIENKDQVVFATCIFTFILLRSLVTLLYLQVIHARPNPGHSMDNRLLLSDGPYPARDRTAHCGQRPGVLLFLWERQKRVIKINRRSRVDNSLHSALVGNCPDPRGLYSIHGSRRNRFSQFWGDVPIISIWRDE